MHKGLLFFALFLFTIEIPAQIIFPSVSDKYLIDSSKLRMGFFQLNAGPDARFSSGMHKAAGGVSPIMYNIHALGLTGRMQSSFLRNYLIKDKNRSVVFGDILAAEISAGGISTTNQVANSGIWLAYRFEFGLGTVIHINNNNDIGITLTLLRFSKDNVSPNFSGSNILARYRHRKWMGEFGIESRRGRMAGWVYDIQGGMNDPIQYVARLACLQKKGKEAGVRAEYFNGLSKYTSDNLSISNAWSIKLYYGIYF